MPSNQINTDKYNMKYFLRASLVIILTMRMKVVPRISYLKKSLNINAVTFPLAGWGTEEKSIPGNKIFGFHIMQAFLRETVNLGHKLLRSLQLCI